LAQNTSNKRRAVTIVGEPKKTKKRKEERHPKQWQTGYSPRPPRLSDQNQTLHGGWPAVCSYTCQVWSKSVKRLRRCGGRKWPFPITLASGLYNSLYKRWWMTLNMRICVMTGASHALGMGSCTKAIWHRRPPVIYTWCRRQSFSFSKSTSSRPPVILF